MSKTIFEKTTLDKFNVFMLGRGQPESKLFDVVEDDLFDEFITSLVLEMGTPLVTKPSVDDLYKLGYGALVAVRVESAEELPRLIVVTDVDIKRYDYNTEQGIGLEDDKIILSAPMLSYIPIFNGLQTFVDPITNICSINAGHVIAIFDYGVPSPRIRNYMLYRAEKAFNRNVLIYRDRREDKSRFLNFIPQYGRFVLNELTNRKRGVSLSKGQYLGNLFVLTKRICEGIPGLDIEYSIDCELFSEAYEKAGKPGWVKQYHCRRWWGGTEGEYKDLPMGHVNIKAFRKWVIRNYKRFTPGSKQLHREAVARCLKCEREQYEDYHRDMRIENGTQNSEYIQNVFRIPE